MARSIGPVYHDYKKTFTDTVKTSDNISSRGISRTLTDTIDTSDTTFKSISRVFTDNPVASDIIYRSISRTLTDTTNISDLISSRGITRTHTDTVGVTDSIVRDFEMSFVDNMTAADSFKRMVGKTFTDTFSVLDTYVRGNLDFKLTYTDNIILQDDIFPQKYSFAIGDIQTDFASVLADVMTEDVTLRQVAVTTDSLGNPATASNTDVTIDCGIKYLTETDRLIIGVGEATRGELVGYFKENYTVSSVTYTVAVGDIIIRNDIYYRITKIFSSFKLGETVIYIQALLERI